MKKLLLIVLTLLMLTGCASQPVFETVDDLPVSGEPAQAKEILVSLPKEASVPTLEGEDDARLYDCGDYILTTQVFRGGDIDGTLQSLTGFPGANLSHVQTKQQNMDRYDCVWTAAGENGEEVGRAVVLDDGAYHYAVSVLADAELAGDLLQQWKTVLNSVKLSTD